jgi:hypothetical protein
VAVLMHSTHSESAPCTCRVTGPDFDQTRFNKACPYHGEGGTMVARIPGMDRIGGPGSPGPKPPRRKSHGRYGRGDDRVPCALCDGYGDVVNPGNADPGRAITDWLPSVGCPRCGQTGKDPKP